MKRVAIYAHFDAGNEVKRYVVHMLRDLAAHCDRVDFVSTADLPAAELDKAAAHCERAFTRENVGYDFSMWQEAMRALDLSEWDELVLTNSSVFGPLSSLSPMFEAMAAAPCDFWSATDNHEIAWHLQSYFLVFKRPVLESEAFARFFQSVLPYRSKWQVIRSYEVGLTAYLTQAGLTARAYVPAASLFPPWPLELAYRYKRKNPTCYHPVRLLERGMPFVKVELLRDNPASVNLAPVRRMMAEAGYDPSLVEYERPAGGWSALGQRMAALFSK